MKNCGCKKLYSKINNTRKNKNISELSNIVNTNNLGITSIELSDNEYIRALSWGGTKWNWVQGSNDKLKYFFGQGLSAENCPPGVLLLAGNNISTISWTQEEKNALVVALRKWTDIIGMDIEEVYSVNEADLKLYLTEDASVSFLGAQFGPHSHPNEGVGIYVRYPGNVWTDSLKPGGYGFYYSYS